MFSVRPSPTPPPEASAHLYKHAADDELQCTTNPRSKLPRLFLIHLLDWTLKIWDFEILQKVAVI